MIASYNPEKLGAKHSVGLDLSRADRGTANLIERFCNSANVNPPKGASSNVIELSIKLKLA
jgi:hypothetical protein